MTFAHETPADVADRLHETRLWTDMTTRPPTPWLSAFDVRMVAAVVAAVAGNVVFEVRQLCVAWTRWTR